MAVSSVAVTEGAGKYLHTWQRSVSSVNREEQYVQLGEPALPTYHTSYIVSTATADSHLVELMSAASVYLRVHRIEIAQFAQPSSATAMQLRVYRVTTAGTGGTAMEVSPYDWSDTASATAMTLPSSKGAEGNLLLHTAMYLDTTTRDRWVWETSPRCKPIVVPSGTTNGIAIKNVTAVATATVVVELWWTETAWL